MRIPCHIQSTGRVLPHFAGQAPRVHNVDVPSSTHVWSSNFYSVNTGMASFDSVEVFVYVRSLCVPSNVHA